MQIRNIAALFWHMLCADFNLTQDSFAGQNCWLIATKMTFPVDPIWLSAVSLRMLKDQTKCCRFNGATEIVVGPMCSWPWVMQSIPWFLHVNSFATLIKRSQICCCWPVVAKLLLLTIVLQRHQSILWCSADLLNIVAECDARSIQLVNIIVECLVPRNSEHTMGTIGALVLQSWGALQCWRKQAFGLITCQTTLSSLSLWTGNPMLLSTNVKLEKSERIASNSEVGFPGFGVSVCWSCASGLPSVCSPHCARQFHVLPMPAFCRSNLKELETHSTPLKLLEVLHQRCQNKQIVQCMCATQWKTSAPHSFSAQVCLPCDVFGNFGNQIAWILCWCVFKKINAADRCIYFLNFCSFVAVSLCFICLFECWCCKASSPVCAITSLHVWLKNSMTCNFRFSLPWINHTLLLFIGYLFSFLRVHESWDMYEMCRPCLAVAHLDWYLKTLPQGEDGYL